MLPDYEDLRLDRDLMEMMCEIRRMDNEIGEIILTSGEMVTWVDEVIDTEIQAYEKGGYDEPPGLRDAYHVAGLFVLPWDPEEVCELDSYITGEMYQMYQMGWRISWIGSTHHLMINS